MSRPLSLLLSCSVLLGTGCSSKTGQQNGTATAELKRITLHVKDMAQRLDLA